MTDSLKILAQKLFDNSIDAKEIDDLIKNLSTDKYFEFDFFMELTYLFFKDFSSTITSANKISKILPNFNLQYIKFCINSNFDSFFSNDKSKNDFYDQLHSLIILFVNNDFIQLNYIIKLLDYTSQINLSFAQKIIKSFPQIIQESPQTLTNIKKFDLIINQSINDPTLCLDVAWPSIIIGDSNNPRISKFGGCQPYLPEEGITLCHKCHSKSSMVCQIYIPSTPKWFQEKFPINYRDSLIVVFYCNSCFLNIEVKLYKSDQLDSLVYEEDVYYPGVSANYTFNDPRIVTGWTSGKMLPSLGNSILNEIADRNSIHCEALDNQYSRFNYINGPSDMNRTYLGGWPEFVQHDCTPSDSFLVINLSQSCSSTAMWGDAGTAQVWMKNQSNDSFGDLIANWACY